MMSYIVLASFIVGVNPKLLTAICEVESGLDEEAIQLYDGSTHSIGVCQVKVGTARQMGYEVDTFELLNPYLNAKVASKYLKWQIKRYGGDTKKGIIAYNRGNYKEGYDETYYCNVRQKMGKSCD